MSRFVGLSLMCLMFMASHAEPEFAGSSWSLQMSQSNGDPIQVQAEQKEYDQTGVTLHRKSRGIIEDGVYKPLSENDENGLISQAKTPVKLRNIRPLQQDTATTEFDRRHDEGKIFEHKRHGDHPRMRGRHGFDFEGGKPWKMKRHRHRKDHMKDFREDEENPQMMPQHKRLHHPYFVNSMNQDIDNKIRNRSRVSFIRPFEKMFSRIFGNRGPVFEPKRDYRHGMMHGHKFDPRFAKHEDEKEMMPSRRSHMEKHRYPAEDREDLFENFNEIQREMNQNFAREMRAFEDSFFDEYEDEY